MVARLSLSLSLSLSIYVYKYGPSAISFRKKALYISAKGPYNSAKEPINFTRNEILLLGGEGLCSSKRETIIYQRDHYLPSLISIKILYCSRK